MASERVKARIPKFISPQKVLQEMGLRQGNSVIDVGSGSGHWSMEAAKIVGGSGSVLAIENDIDMLRLINVRSQTEGVAGVKTEMIDFEKGPFPKEKADLVVLSNILWTIVSRERFIDQVARLVAKDGRLLLVEWEPRKTIFGPPLEARISEEEAINLFEGSGLHFACTAESGHFHYALVFDHKGEGCAWKKGK